MFTGYRTKADIMGDTEHTNAKMIAHCTVEYKSGDDQIVRYQDTDIITKKPNGHLILNSGGYRTPTTKQRINYHLKHGEVYQENSIWYYVKEAYWKPTSTPVVFYDDMRINTRGTVIGRKPKPEKVEAQIKALKKRIAGFVKLIDNDLPQPSGGDCWDCRMIDENGKPIERLDHLKGHIKEGYLHGTLLVNAMKAAGYQDAQLPFHYMLAQNGSRDFFKRAVRKYLFTRLSTEIL